MFNYQFFLSQTLVQSISPIHKFAANDCIQQIEIINTFTAFNELQFINIYEKVELFIETNSLISTRSSMSLYMAHLSLMVSEKYFELFFY